MKFSVSNVQGAISYRNEVLRVRVFPSGKMSETPLSMNDWLVTDFRARPVRHAGYIFHKGFLDAWMQIDELVRHQIQQFDPGAIKLDGLSMGGAVSGVGAALLALSGLPVVHTSYGSPRFLWGKKSRDRFDEHVYSTRHVYGKDLVTSLPPAWWGYLHGGAAVKMEREEKWKPFQRIRDHFPWGYAISGWSEP